MRILAALPVVALLGLAACGEDPASQTGSTNNTNPPPASTAPANPTPPASTSPSSPPPATPAR